MKSDNVWAVSKVDSARLGSGRLDSAHFGKIWFWLARIDLTVKNYYPTDNSSRFVSKKNLDQLCAARSCSFYNGSKIFCLTTCLHPTKGRKIDTSILPKPTKLLEKSSLNPDYVEYCIIYSKDIEQIRQIKSCSTQTTVR